MIATITGPAAGVVIIAVIIIMIWVINLSETLAAEKRKQKEYWDERLAAYQKYKEGQDHPQ